MGNVNVPAPREEHRLSVTLALGEPSVITVAGEADLESIAPLQRALDRALGHHPHVVLDLSGLSFADSTVLSTLLLARSTAAEQGGSIRLSAASDCVRHLLTVTGVLPLLPVGDTAYSKPQRM